LVIAEPVCGPVLFLEDGQQALVARVSGDEEQIERQVTGV
jgi:hypothetical protein